MIKIAWRQIVVLKSTDTGAVTITMTHTGTSNSEEPHGTNLEPVQSLHNFFSVCKFRFQIRSAQQTSEEVFLAHSAPSLFQRRKELRWHWGRRGAKGCSSCRVSLSSLRSQRLEATWVWTDHWLRKAPMLSGSSSSRSWLIPAQATRGSTAQMLKTQSTKTAVLERPSCFYRPGLPVEMWSSKRCSTSAVCCAKIPKDPNLRNIA